MKEKLRVLFAAFEAAPFMKTGGLGDVAASLPGAVQCPTIEMRVVLPKLRQIPAEYQEKMKFLCSFYVPLGCAASTAGSSSCGAAASLGIFLITNITSGATALMATLTTASAWRSSPRPSANAAGICRTFSRTFSTATTGHTALAPVFLREQYRYAPGYSDIRTVFTIHNLKFQGQYSPHVLSDILGLDGVAAARNQLLRDDGKCVNYLAGAVSYSDRVTTVSPTYAKEICTPYFGEGLQDLFLRRHDILSGILNGIDTVSYDPAKDKALVHNYTDPDGKAANKKALQEELGLTVDNEVPLCVCVSRLTEQKGFDLLNAVAEEMLSCAQIAVLGTGDRAYEDYYRSLEARHPGRFSAQIRFSEPLSRRMYAGADIFLMPSRFEPCGLSQMISMRYGTVPVVRQTGGLADSVEPYNRYTGEGTGFGFLNFNAHELLFTTQEACRLYTESPVAWGNLAAQGMAKDFSWRASALEYRKLYRGLFT